MEKITLAPSGIKEKKKKKIKLKKAKNKKKKKKTYFISHVRIQLAT